MGNMIAGAGSFLLSLIAGDAFSTILSPTEKIIKVLAEKDLNELLDEYHKWFIREHDSEISSCNEDMVLFKSKRKEILNSFEKYYLKSIPDINTNREKQFLQEAYIIVSPLEPISEIGKKYLSDFFQIVLTKKTGVLSSEVQAIVNSISDQINDEFSKQNRRISRAEEKIERYNPDKSGRANLDKYYTAILHNFTEPNEEESADLVGEESDEKAYIDAYIGVGPENKLFLRYLDEWFVQKDHGVILLYGEPGHGKSTLCKKATVEYIRGNLLKDKAKNVLTVSLNTGYNPTIIQDGDIKISNALVWGPDREGVFSYEDCRGSLLFMDGFDEFIDAARTNDKDTNIISFIKRIDKIARQYKIHVVVLSRTTAVQKYLENGAILNRSFHLLPITEEQQNNWMERHAEYNDYRDTFNFLRKNGNMRELLGIPLLFRLIVYNRFNKISSNIVELYNNLFSHLMDKRNIRDEKLMSVRKDLMNLAYDIYCTDTNLAVMKEKEPDKDWVFAFYLTISGIEQGGLQSIHKVGFYHRTFYQYFLAQYIYCNLLNVTNRNAKKFIGYFAERELDEEVKTYLSLMLKEADKETIYSKMDIVFDALSETEGFYNLIPKYSYGDVEKSRINRATNVYRNVMHIAYALSYVIQIPFMGKLDILSRTFRSNKLRVYSNAEKKADLRGAYLIGADLSEANLCDATLGGAVLIGAYLCEAKLIGTDLSGADLREADLSGADLNKSDLSGADLRGADLSGADLIGADLSRAKLNEADLSGAYLIGANLLEAQLIRADLSRADLIEAKLIGADLSRAKLFGANLLEAQLIGADLSKADLSRIDLSRADLSRATIDTGINMVNSLFQTIIDIKYKELIHKDIEGYDSIIWLDYESQE